MQVPNDKVKQQLDIAARRRAQGRSTSIDEAALNYAEKRYGYKAPAAPTLDDQYTNAKAQYNAAIERQNQLSNAGFGLRPALQQALNQRSPEFGLDRAALEARYGNPQSPLYIDNPFVRDAVIQRATSGQQQAFSTIADRLQGLLGLQTAQQGQLVQGLQNKVSNYGDQLSAQAKARQQQFENDLALQRLAISRAGLGQPSRTEKMDAIEQSFNEDLTGFKTNNLVQTDSKYGDSRMKREDVILQLAQKYPELSPVDIATKVYKFFPSSQESARKQTSTDLLSALLPGLTGITQ